MRRYIDQFSLPAGFAGLVVLAVAIAEYLLKTRFDWTARGLTVLGIMLLALFFYGNSVTFRRRMGTRQLRYGTNAIVMVVALFAILVLVNIFVARNAKQWDLTAGREFSLSPNSLRALENVKEPIKVLAFYSTGDASEQKAKDLLKQYEVNSDKISHDFIDPDVKPAEAQKYEIRDYGTMVFLRGSRRQDVTSLDESSITSAILRVTADKAIKVAFLTGHGEKSIDVADRTGYRQVKALLEQNNYDITNINLSTGTLTNDYAVLIVAGPRSLLLDNEKDAIKKYLDGGGRMLVMADPNVENNVTDLITKWGVEVGKGIAVDPTMSFMGDLSTMVVQKYLWSAITKDMRGMTVLPLATNVTKKIPAPEGIWYDTLLETSDSGWVETDPQMAKYDQGTDIKGPVAMGVAVTEQTPPEPGKPPTAANDHPKVVVFGDSDFVANGFISMGANADLFLNSVNWLAQSEQEIQIKPKPPIDKSLTLSSGQGNFILLSSAALIPGIVLAAGAAVWWRRR